MIQRYLTGIFQSQKVDETPPIQDAFHRFTNYDTYIHVLDQDITIKELNEAIDNVGTGTSLDGISPELAVLFPIRLREVIVIFFNKFCWLFPGRRFMRGKPIQLLFVRIFDPLLCVCRHLDFNL